MSMSSLDSAEYVFKRDESWEGRGSNGRHGCVPNYGSCVAPPSLSLLVLGVIPVRIDRRRYVS